MKKILGLISILICLSMLLASCGGDPVPSAQSSNTADSEQTGSSVDSSTVDSSTVDSSTVDSSTVDSSTVDSSTVDSSTVDSSTVDSSTTASSKDDKPKPDPEPDVPDGPIDIAVNGETQYVVVYDDSDVSVSSFATSFVNYVKDRYNISFDMVKESEGTSSIYCIYIGDVAGAQKAKSKFNETNDFGAVVSGNDYVLYATNSRLYSYLYDILVSDVLVTIRSGNWNTRPAKNMIYHKSDYAETTYVDYVLAQYGGKLTQEALLKLFEPRTFVASDGTELVYRLYAPYDYESTDELPLLMLMHGANDRGNDNVKNLSGMTLKLFSQENSPMWDSIVIAPQCPVGQQWVDTPWLNGGYRVDEVPESNEMKAVFEIIDLITDTFPTDTDRYYVTGLSMGGFATWDMIMRHPEMFAGAVPICGGGDYKQAYKLVDMPIYTVHNKNDGDVPVSGTKEMAVALEMLKSEVFFYEELDIYGHNVWDYASEKVEIWQWLYSQSK